MADLIVTATFSRSNGDIAATGLTLADIDLYLTRQNRSTGVDGVVWDGTQNPTEEIDNVGAYSRILADPDFSTYVYYARGTYTGAVILDSDTVTGAQSWDTDRIETLIERSAAITAIVTTIAANVVIILARIGAFTGTGVNTILGFLRAMSRNDLAAPSDMGGTFAPLRHSLQALFSLFIRAECAGTVSADELTVVRGDSYDSDDDNAIEGLGDISTYTKIWITAKHSKDQDDAEAIFMVLLSNPAVPLTDGLQYLNGAESDALDVISAISRTWGAITISDAVAGDIAFTLDEDATDDLVPSELDYDIQWTDGTDVETVRDDRVAITADVTRAIA